jgi:sugar/nucleoside kinase (ribokinase family)
MMMTAVPIRHHVFTTGNAMVDVLGQVDDALLPQHGLRANDSRPFDDHEMLKLYQQMQATTDLTIMSGGSAANTAAIVAHLGGSAAYCGRVGDDELGTMYGQELADLGVATAIARDPAAPTGRVLSLITHNGDRAMTFTLGACANLHPQDLLAEQVTAAHFTLVEGYSWGSPGPFATSMAAVAIAKQAGRRVAFTLSALFMIAPNRQAFLDFIAESVDVLIGNEEEFGELLQLQTAPREDLLAAARPLAPVVVVTLAGDGAVALVGDDTYRCNAVPVPRVVDATGAGDSFAGAMLYKLAKGAGFEEALALGAATASKVISQIGARLPHQGALEKVG